MTREYCIKCDEVTGHAGRHDGSLYLESGVGPLCEHCYDHLRVEEIEAQVDRIQNDRDSWRRTAEKLGTEQMKLHEALSREVDATGAQMKRAEAAEQRVRYLRRAVSGWEHPVAEMTSKTYRRL